MIKLILAVLCGTRAIKIGTVSRDLPSTGTRATAYSAAVSASRVSAARRETEIRQSGFLLNKLPCLQSRARAFITAMASGTS